LNGLEIPRILMGVAVMAVVTYLLRMLPVVLFKKKLENPFVLSFLFYIPYAVLAAMTLPDILYSTASLLSALAGLAAAVLLARMGRGLLTVALGAAAAVFVAERVIALL
jgi:branched-subunit amino acid transport protein